MVLKIGCEKKYGEDLNEFDLDLMDEGIVLHPLKGTSYKNLLTNKKLFLEIMKNDIEVQKDYLIGENRFNELEEYKARWKKYKKMFDNFDEEVEYVEVLGGEEEYDEYLDRVYNLINNDKKLKDKKIIISEQYDFCKSDYIRLKELKEKFKNNDLYIRLDGNFEFVSIDLAFKTIEKIVEKVNYIKSFKLTPLEEIMLAYDLIRGRDYIKSDSNDLSKSRCISNVLFEDEIVCAGFARIFKSTLDYLGYDARISTLKFKEDGNKPGHDRNTVYIKDPKYGIDGVYYFDLTWDCKTAGKEECEDAYLLSYTFFAKTRDELEKIENYIFEYQDTKKYSKNIINELKDAINKKDTLKYMKIMQTIKHIDSLTHVKKIDYNDCNPPFFNNEVIKNKKVSKNIIDKSTEVVNNFNKPLSAEKYIDLLVNVRKVESEIDKEKYIYTVSFLCNILKNSGWKFKNSTGNIVLDFELYTLRKGYTSFIPLFDTEETIKKYTKK